jgi:hypothetical protein
LAFNYLLIQLKKFQYFNLFKIVSGTICKLFAPPFIFLVSKDL